MIKKIGQIMLYVNDQDAAVKFWTEKVGFVVKAEEDNGQGFRWIEIAQSSDSETSIVLHNKEFVAKMSPGLHLGTPSLMFYSDNLEELRSDLSNKNVIVGEIVNMPSGKVFNFADDEENYFAVMQK
ncbi:MULTISPECIES: VOC family protein [unclassified Bacillus (in: firmicutes)]|uniref:VOC family protein n=1 Tax=unclassified Bacillus (in: firmicutes) TaxID=185979 RepID=UPI001BECAB03|nr:MULTISPECIES: VOC family protein [unclassified Bacillus (in: firmicutes)]MBT2640478.1 VOC family protein [Bacillus sp. ISL-39]MBT2663410.1 VOC family protein [Bacillus sp. ISL-45]